LILTLTQNLSKLSKNTKKIQKSKKILTGRRNWSSLIKNQS
jgi:hypothetical protein